MTVARIVMVTGATGAIGEAIARQLAERPEHEVVLACRDADRAARTRERIRRATGNDAVRVELVDVSSRASVAALAERWRGPLHVLINNAAQCPRERRVTPEGLELQFATNVMGYVWTMLSFERILADSSPARVINVASYWAGGLDLDDLQFERRRYDNDDAYRQSKQANRMLTVAFAKRFADHGVTVNACHPGDVNSKLSNDLGFGGGQTPDEGAATPVWLARSQEGGRLTGRYFARCSEQPCSFSKDRKAIEALYRICLGHASG